MNGSHSEAGVTQLLHKIESGEAAAAESLLPLVYDELRKLAAQRMAGQAPGHTLQPTALVHEAWIRLTGNPDAQWNDRTHFFRAAAEAMRRILIDSARSKAQQKRDGGQRVELADLELATSATPETLMVVHEALERFSAVDEAKAELVKLRFFAGLTLEEAAGALEISEATAKRAWAFARAWLFREIKRLQTE